MAVTVRTRRLVANPHRRAKRKKYNPQGHRRRMTAKQLKYFGTKRQKAALKAHRTRKRRKVPTVPSAALRRALHNPRKIRARRRKAPAKRRRQTVNPALLITLGAANPKRRSTVAKRRRKAHRAANPRRRRRTTRVVVAAPRRHHNVTHRRQRHHNPRRRQNPAFGMKGMGMTKAVVAGMAGMAVAKFLPTMVPAGIINGNLMRTVATGASAFVAQMVAKAVVKDQAIADAVLFGGLIQTGSVALNAFLPGLASSLGLSGIMDADWTIPENPLKQHPMALPPVAGDARANMAGLARAYGSAY